MIFSTFKWKENSVLELSRPTSAYIYYRQTRLNLLTGFPETYPLEHFLEKLDSIQLQDAVKNPTVFHFYYELGLVLQGLGHPVPEDAPLAVELVYAKKKVKKKPTTKLASIPLRTLERPTWSEYKTAFQKIQEHLLEGNCYQVNLTYPFDFETEEMLDPRDIVDFFFAQKKLGAYAHATFLGEDMIVSNSPECLFQFRGRQIFTMPIKGTVKRTKSLARDWKKLLTDVKEESELNMITDLLRNDLNRLDTPSARVVRERAPLKVPGLLHQYSLISVNLKKKVSLRRTIDCLFPGGSITGAPKKNVMGIIQSVERSPRGIYCGSTLLCIGKDKVASINIRTAMVSVGERLWRYGAGGGITLLSKSVFEYNEMEAKVSSFLTFLKAPGYRNEFE